MLYSIDSCSVFAFLLDVVGCETMMSFALLAVSRFIAVGHPDKKKRLFTWKVGFITCMLTWAYAIIMAICDISVRGGVFNKEIWMCMVNLSVDLTANVLFFLFSFMLSTVVLAYCYIKIYRIFRKSNAAVFAEGTPDLRIYMKRKTEQKRLAIQLLVIYGIYNICWGPFAAVELFLDSAGNYPSWLYSILLVLLCVNSAVNVFVYMHYNRAFRFVCLKGL